MPLHLVLLEQFLVQLFRVRIHSSELVEREETPVSSYPCLTKNSRAVSLTLDSTREKYECDRAHNQANDRANDIHQSFNRQRHSSDGHRFVRQQKFTRSQRLRAITAGWSQRSPHKGAECLTSDRR